MSDENVEKEEEEYVLLNLDEVRCHIDITPNAPYVLSVCFSTCNFLLLYFSFSTCNFPFCILPVYFWAALLFFVINTCYFIHKKKIYV